MKLESIRQAVDELLEELKLDVTVDLNDNLSEELAYYGGALYTSAEGENVIEVYTGIYDYHKDREYEYITIGRFGRFLEMYGYEYNADTCTVLNILHEIGHAYQYKLFNDKHLSWEYHELRSMFSSQGKLLIGKELREYLENEMSVSPYHIFNPIEMVADKFAVEYFIKVWDRIVEIDSVGSFDTIIHTYRNRVSDETEHMELIKLDEGQKVIIRFDVSDHVRHLLKKVGTVTYITLVPMYVSAEHYTDGITFRHILDGRLYREGVGLGGGSRKWNRLRRGCTRLEYPVTVIQSGKDPIIYVDEISIHDFAVRGSKHFVMHKDDVTHYLDVFKEEETFPKIWNECKYNFVSYNNHGMLGPSVKFDEYLKDHVTTFDPSVLEGRTLSYDMGDNEITSDIGIVTRPGSLGGWTVWRYGVEGLYVKDGTRTVRLTVYKGAEKKPFWWNPSQSRQTVLQEQ